MKMSTPHDTYQLICDNPDQYITKVGKVYSGTHKLRRITSDLGYFLLII